MRVSLIRLSILLACLGLASQASAQSTNLNTVSKSGTISAIGGAVEFTTATIGGLGGGFGSVKVQTLDSYSGTWEVQCSVDGITYDTASELKLTPTDGTSVAYSVTDTVAIWDVGNASGCQSIRVMATAGFADSNVTVAITATQSGGSSGGGGGGGGSSDTTEATQLLVLADTGEIASSTAATVTRLDTLLAGLAEDCADGSTFACTGPATMLRFDAVSPASVTEGQASSWRGTATGEALTVLFDAAGNNRGANVDSSNRLQVFDASVGLEDVAETAGGGLARMGAVVRLAAAGSTSTDADNATVNVDTLGLLWTRQLDPCSGTAKTYLAIDITTATTTELTAALSGASNYYYICSVNLVTTAANSVALVDDDTDNCASVTSGLNGGLTAAEGWAFGANGGLTLGNGQGSVMRTNGTNRVLCMVTSAATELHGTVVIATAP